MSEGVSNESAQQVVNERLPSDQGYTEKFVQALALDLLDARARVKELESFLGGLADWCHGHFTDLITVGLGEIERALRGEEEDT
jgi:hypothetical protein